MPERRDRQGTIEIRNVTVRRRDRTVLDDISCTLGERRIGIVGANGSGKSTFARLLNGLIQPDAGTVHVEGLDARRQTKAVRREIGFLFQNPDNQIVYPTVGEDIAFGLKGRRLDRSEIDRRVAAVLERFALTGFADRLVHELSGGERQMVAFAGVLVLEPRWLVLDEPTTLLDLRNARRVMRTLEEIEQKVVLVTHDLKCLTGFDRVLVIEAGRIVHDAVPDAAIDAYRRLAA